MLNFCKVYFDYLKFEGSDRLDLMNRLSTNEVNSLEKYRLAKTILTSDKGRIIDVITIFNFGDFVFALCSGGNSDKVISHLDKYTIMDDFRAVNMAGSHDSLLFFGDDAESYCADVLGKSIPKPDHKTFSAMQEEGNDAIIAPNNDGFGGFYFIYANEGKDGWDKKLFSAGLTAKYRLNEISAGQFETLRIELGIPGFGKEMSERTNPLECGLWDYVSFTKGCYIGQEVIARLDTYDKISKHLIGVKLKEPISESNENDELNILLHGNRCGFVTSSAFSQKFGNIALGFVKTNMLDYKKEYKIASGKKEIDCSIVKLPFA